MIYPLGLVGLPSGEEASTSSSRRFFASAIFNLGLPSSGTASTTSLRSESGEAVCAFGAPAPPPTDVDDGLGGEEAFEVSPWTSRAATSAIGETASLLRSASAPELLGRRGSRARGGFGPACLAPPCPFTEFLRCNDAFGLDVAVAAAPQATRARFSRPPSQAASAPTSTPVLGPGGSCPPCWWTTRRTWCARASCR